LIGSRKEEIGTNEDHTFTDTSNRWSDQRSGLKSSMILRSGSLAIWNLLFRTADAEVFHDITGPRPTADVFGECGVIEGG
jgi:hypothetical protein